MYSIQGRYAIIRLAYLEYLRIKKNYVAECRRHWL